VQRLFTLTPNEHGHSTVGRSSPTIYVGGIQRNSLAPDERACTPNRGRSLDRNVGLIRPVSHRIARAQFQATDRDQSVNRKKRTRSLCFDCTNRALIVFVVTTRRVVIAALANACRSCRAPVRAFAALVAVDLIPRAELDSSLVASARSSTGSACRPVLARGSSRRRPRAARPELAARTRTTRLPERGYQTRRVGGSQKR